MNKPWPCLKCLIIMELVDEDHCKCPKCKTEVWYEYDDDSSEDDIDELTLLPSHIPQANGPDFSILGGPPLMGGGSKSKASSNKKQLMKKPSTFEIYNRLAGTKSPKPRANKTIDS